jgi:Endonuclease I
LIDNVQDSVEGIYSGLKLFLPENVDASEWLFMNGNGINLEHVYPQSKGADEGQAGHSDMHHLYPSRVAVNSARASFPFANIPDPMTTTWFRKNTSMQNIPSSNIDSYSESINGAFEPRESVKGNIARSVFYFYTMYQDDADAADPNFFPSQRPTLCEWHLADIVDESELMRSAMVAQYQDGKENPFVLDCTAALRAWCPEYEGCTTAITTSNNQDGTFQLSAYALEGRIIVNIVAGQYDKIRISIHDFSGRMLISEQMTVTEGVTEYSPLMQFVPGMYIVSSITDSGNSQMHITRCIVR